MKPGKLWGANSINARQSLAGLLTAALLVLTVTLPANAQSSGPSDNTSQALPQDVARVLAQNRCAPDFQPSLADLFAIFEEKAASPCFGKLTSPPSVTAGSLMNDPAAIKLLAAAGYVWGLAPEYIERFSKYNTIISAPFNTFKYGTVPAAWNNEATNAGDASVLYVSAFVDFEKSPEQVLTVPPSRNQYYVVAYMDAYANTVGSIGTRTTPSGETTSYLLVGPHSRYADKSTATIRGKTYPVMASDTAINWFLIRVLANTLIDASGPTSVPSVLRDVEHKFALNSLSDFEANGNQPLYPASFTLPEPTQEQQQEAAPYQNAPSEAVDFFTQLGNAVATNPIPNRNTGLSGTSLTDLPPYVTPQYKAKTTYIVPSSGQKRILDLLSPIGLTKSGFHLPAEWGSAQQAALQAGYVLGQQILTGFINQAASTPKTNYWGIVNDPVGTYPSDALGYLYRSLIVIEGGVANLGLDAVYPTLTGNPAPLDGNQTYKLTFTPPTPNPSLPAVGIYPPMVSDANSNPKGFWSIHVYATDPTQGAAPFIAQTSVQNLSFSVANTAVVSVNTATNFMTVKAPDWGTLVASTPILFGPEAATYGLASNTVYYVAGKPTANSDNTYTFQISPQWLQALSPSGHVPIQGPNGQAGRIAELQSPTGAAPLTYGMVKPVTQLGSSQLAANQLARNSDGSLTLWFGPTLPDGAPASNWIPTPSTVYYRPIYPNTQVGTAFQLTLRMYYPTPGNEPPSILPCTEACPGGLPESYIPPVLEVVH